MHRLKDMLVKKGRVGLESCFHDDYLNAINVLFILKEPIQPD